MVSAGDCLMQSEPCGGSVRDIHLHHQSPDVHLEERLHDPQSFHVPLRDPQRLHSSSGSLRADDRHRGFRHSSNVLYECAEGPTAAQRLDDPHRFREPRGLCDPQGLHGDLQDLRFRDSQIDPRGFSNPYALHDPRGFQHPRRVSDSHEFHNPQRLYDPQEFHRSWGSVCRRLRVDRLISGRSDDLHRPYSNLAAATFPAVSDVTSKDPRGGRVTSMSVGSVDSVQRPLVKFFSLPNVDEIRRQTSTGTGSVASELWDSTFESRCLDRPSTFVSMPCISSHQRGAGRGRTQKRFLPTLSISEEVSVLSSVDDF